MIPHLSGSLNDGTKPAGLRPGAHVPGGDNWWVGTLGMNAPIKGLASGLGDDAGLAYLAKVEDAARVGEGWQLRFAESEMDVRSRFDA